MKNDTGWMMTLIAVGFIIIAWLIVSFITMDFGWPIHTGMGRLGAVVIVFITIRAALEA